MIRRLWYAYHAEVTKALKRKLTYAGPALVTIAVVSMVFVRHIKRDAVGDYGFVASATPIGLNLLGLLLLLMYTAALVSTELGHGTVCLTLVRPLRRFEFILAKVLLGLTYAATLTLSAAVASWALVLAFGDLNGVVIGDEVVYTNIEMVQAYLIGMALVLLPQSATVAYAVMMSSFTRSTGAAIGGTVGLWILVDVAKHPLRIAPYLFSSYIERPWNVFLGRCDGLNPSWFPDATHIAVTSLAAAVVCTGVAIFAFGRRDLRA